MYIETFQMLIVLFKTTYNIQITVYLGKKTSIWRLKTALRTDERVRLMNEIIQGIQVIKMYAWEKPFAKMIAALRKKEIRIIRYVSYIRGVMISFIMFSTRVSIFVSLVAFALLGNYVTAEKAFVVICYYNILRQTMTVYFPQGISQLAETLVSVSRLEKYMHYKEISEEHYSIHKDTLITTSDSTKKKEISSKYQEEQEAEFAKKLINGKNRSITAAYYI